MAEAREQSGERIPAGTIESGPSPETREAPETTRPETPERAPDESAAAAMREAATAAASTAGTASAIPPDRFRKEIEDILSEDLTDLFLALPPDQKAAFKAKGEETAAKVRDLLLESKVQAKKVLRLIMEWFRMIPSVNKFFLEQAAKIKTDKLLALADETLRRAAERIV